MNDPYRPTAAAKSAALGIVLALIAILLAFFPAGAGHGLSSPLVVSLPLALLLPIALVRSRTGDVNGVGWDIALVIYALSANYHLVGDAIDFRENVGRVHDEYLVPGVHRSVFPMFVGWLGIWLFWQWLAIRTLVRHVLTRAPLAKRP